MDSTRALWWLGSLAWLAVAGATLTGRATTASGLESRRAQVERELAELPALIPSAQTHARVGFYGYAETPAWVVVDLGRSVVPEKVVVFPARDGGPQSSGFPTAFDVEIAADASFEGAVRLARWREPRPGAGDGLPFVSVPGNGAAGRFLRLVVTGFQKDPDGDGTQYFRLGEIVVLAAGQNAALGGAVTSTRSFDSSRRWEAMNLIDGREKGVRTLFSPQPVIWGQRTLWKRVLTPFSCPGRQSDRHRLPLQDQL